MFLYLVFYYSRGYLCMFYGAHNLEWPTCPSLARTFLILKLESCILGTSSVPAKQGWAVALIPVFLTQSFTFSSVGLKWFSLTPNHIPSHIPTPKDNFKITAKKDVLLCIKLSVELHVLRVKSRSRNELTGSGEGATYRPAPVST